MPKYLSQRQMDDFISQATDKLHSIYQYLSTGESSISDCGSALELDYE